MVATKMTRSALTAGARVVVLLVGALMIAGLLAPAAGAAVPDVTGTWGGKPGDKNWHLVASGPGLEHLHGDWGGTAASGHAALHGTFEGTLSGDTYTGTFSVTEESVHSTGTISFRVASPTLIDVSLRVTGGYGAGGPLQSFVLHWQGSTSKEIDDDLLIDFSYYANSLPTVIRAGPRVPLPGYGGCPAAEVPAHISGHFETHRRYDLTFGTAVGSGHVNGSGTVSAEPLDAKCRVPVLDFVVEDVVVTVSGTTITAVFTVRVSQTAETQPGQCEVVVPGSSAPFFGTITATENEAVTAANGLATDTIHFGPWTRPCNAFDQTITNNISSIPADGAGSTWVRAFIGCLSTGYSPRNCTEPPTS